MPPFRRCEIGLRPSRLYRAAARRLTTTTVSAARPAASSIHGARSLSNRWSHSEISDSKRSQRGLDVIGVLFREVVPREALKTALTRVPSEKCSATKSFKPRNTPPDIIGRLNQEINIALTDPKIKQRIAELADTPLSLSVADFTKLISDETEKWGKVIRAAGIKGPD